MVKRVMKLTLGGGYVRSLCKLCIVYIGVTDAELHTVHCAKCRALLSGLWPPLPGLRTAPWPRAGEFHH